MDSVTEVWKSVPGYPFYEVSNQGRVRSISRVVEQVNRWGSLMKRRCKGKILTMVNHHGYHVVKPDPKGQPIGVHRLVAWAFIGPQEREKVVNHIDGNKTNNIPSNLEFISTSENVSHAYRTGLLSNRGTTNGKATLNDEIVRLIRKSFGTHAEIAEIVGCTKAQVAQVRSGKTWGHVV